MADRLGTFATRLVVPAWILAVALAGLVAFQLLRPVGPSTALPTVRSLGMPVARAALDRTLRIRAKPGVTDTGSSRLQIESRYGQFRGHWWWNHGWVYVSGSVLPGTRIHVHLDDRSLTVSETPAAHATSQIGHYGRYGFVSIIQVDAVRFGIGVMFISNPATGGPFAGPHVLDQIDGRAWTERGLTITQDHVTFNPARTFPCASITRSPNRWALGCQMFGQRPLVSDRHGHFTALSGSLPDAKAVSLTSTADVHTRLPTDSMQIVW
jgi:hypothetical protein